MVGHRENNIQTDTTNLYKRKNDEEIFDIDLGHPDVLARFLAETDH